MKKNNNIKSKKLESLIKKIKLQIKPNPNNFLIVKKWNNNIFQKYKTSMFQAIEEEIELQLKLEIKESFNNFVEVNNLIK